jgi:hypothetical protein
MKFLKTLQKKQLEQSSDIDAADNSIAPNKKKRRKINRSAEHSIISETIIGKPQLPYDDVKVDLSEENAVDFNNSSLDGKTFEAVVRTTVDPGLVNQHLVAITQPTSVYCEEYRSLRTHILHKSQRQKLQSIVVASVGPSEGKSITALNLSWLLSQTDGIKALIIDSDLRRPSLAAYLGLEAKLGLSDILGGKSTIEDTIIRLEPSGLHLLPGGIRAPTSPNFSPAPSLESS